MRKLTAVLIASSLMLGVSAANAADTTAPQTANTNTMGNGNGMMSHHHQMGYQKGARHDSAMLAGIELTPEQRQQIRDIRQQFRAAHPMQHGMDHVQQMHRLVASDKFDEAAARSQIEANNKMRNDLALARMKMENQIYNLLTPEQKTQVNQNFEKRVQRMMAYQDKMDDAQQ